jgi:hypothetical protein
MSNSRPLPRPVGLVVMLVVVIVLPLAFYVLVRTGVQPGANFLARQFGGTDAVTLPRGLVQAFALVAAVWPPATLLVLDSTTWHSVPAARGLSARRCRVSPRHVGDDVR